MYRSGSLHGCLGCAVLFVSLGAVSAFAFDVPRDVDALHYDLSLDVDPENQRIEGSNAIRVRALAADVETFCFRLDDVLTITDLTVNGVAASWQRLEYPVVEVALDRAYQPNEEFTVTVHYAGTPTGDDCRDFGCRGFRFQSTPARDQYTIATCSQPWLAYHWLPGVDDNRDKTTARIRVTVPDPLIVASNGVLVATEPAGSGRTRYVWESNYPMVDSLYAICATDYVKFTAEWQHATGTMPVEFYIWPEDDTPARREVLLSTLDMLDVLSEVFGPYPFVDEKYGLAQYGFGNGMEHQTLTCFKSFAPSPYSMQDFLAHELAHQWWGDMVTAATWSDMWLHEGFASYGQVLWDERKPDALPGALKSAIYAHHPYTMQGTVYLFPDDIVDWDDVYSFTVYEKGAWVLHMLRYAVGDDMFFAILREYRQRYEFSHATTEQFVVLVEEMTQDDWAWFFDPWLYEEGYPDYDCGLRQFELGGQHYAELYVQQTQPAQYPIFQCPVELGVMAGGPRYRFWSDAREEHILIPIEAPLVEPILDPDWWLLHWGGGCFYPFVEGPPKIVALTPAPETLLDPDAVMSLAITWHKDVAVTAADITVTDDLSAAVPFDLAYESASHTATLAFVGPLLPGEYSVTINDTITDVAASLALDGELAVAKWDPLLPSGDGLPGGAAEYKFAVTSGVTGDLDYDGDLDFADILHFAACLTGPDRSCAFRCRVGDADQDEDIDIEDLAAIQSAY